MSKITCPYCGGTFEEAPRAAQANPWAFPGAAGGYKVVEYCMLPRPHGLRRLFTRKLDGCTLRFLQTGGCAQGELWYRYEGYPYVFPVTKEMMCADTWLPAYRKKLPALISTAERVMLRRV